MIHLCLDANTLLGLYGLTPREIAEFNKLAALIKAGELTLWLPEIVIDEYDRNRPKVIAEALKSLRESRLSVNAPSLSEGLPERTTLQECIREVQKAHSILLALLERQAAGERLPADEAVQLLIGVARRLPTGPVLAAARERRELRRPPGKADSLGDAVVWEALLKGLPNDEDLHFVSSDADFRSPLSRSRIHEYLESEWGTAKSSQVMLYPHLASFLAKHFAGIQLPSDIPKVRLIQRLATSGTFETTHDLIEKLSRYDVFTPEQAAMIANHAVRNNQVRWVARDDDVRGFLTRLIDTHRSAIDPAHVGILERCISGDEPAYSSIDLDGEKL